jgi:transposase
VRHRLLRAVLNVIFYLLRTGCQWRLLAREFPPCGTVYHYFQAWQNSGVCGFIYIAVDTLGLLVANRVETADTSDRRAGALLLGGSCGLFPRIRTIIADAGHESRKLARTLQQHQGWQLRIVKRRQRAFKITGLT